MIGGEELELVWTINVILMAFVVVLLAVMLWGRSGILRQRKLEKEIEELRNKLVEYAKAKPVAPMSGSDLYELVKDLETLRSAIAGAKICQRTILKKYKTRPGAEALEKILARSKLPEPVKQRLADEFLVGEAGREIIRLLDRGETIERISAEVGMPLIVTKSQITRLQILGYLDGRLKPTEKGRRALQA
ncbi:MAG: hypothetical protein QXP51_04415 [Candidatus Hadarchaeales archaeon]